MPQIQPFRGLRYDLGQVGSLSDVVAPPYDVIDAEYRDLLYKRHPANVIRLILNRDEPGDDDQTNRYSRAARFLKRWGLDGVLVREPNPAVYVYHQSFEYEGQQINRRGFMARLRLERFGEGCVYPHEETHSAAKQDRLKLLNACRANLSQIFGLYRDPENSSQQLLELAIQNTLPLEATDDLAVVHRFWPVTDLTTIGQLSASLQDRSLFIADGHHRYETACDYRDQLAEAGKLDSQHPSNFVLAMFVSMSDPGMIVLPTHRLFRGLPPISSQRLTAALGKYFEVEVLGSGTEHANSVWQKIEQKQDQGTLGFYTREDDQWVLAKIQTAGQKKMAEISADRSEHWRQLGVSLLHHLVMDLLLGHKELPRPMYVHNTQEVQKGLKQGDATGRDATGQAGSGSHFELACLVMPATLQHVQDISLGHERMPAKSTYFYPKLLSGLVINPLT
jgi:uncharacterized protein (DUF1015 family)